MEDGEEDRALDREAELPLAELARDHAADPEFAPEPFYYYGRADPAHAPGAEAAGLLPFDEAHLEREAREALHDPVDVAFGLELVPDPSGSDVGPTLRVGEAPERRDDALPDLPALAEGLDDLEVLPGAGGLDTYEHGSRLLSPANRDTASRAAAGRMSRIVREYRLGRGATLLAAAAGNAPDRPPGPVRGQGSQDSVEDGLDAAAGATTIPPTHPTAKEADKEAYGVDRNRT